MDYSKIPEELKELNQWVCCWDNSKVPMRAFERKAASSIDPKTWSDFEQAVWAVENRYYDHIGFVFNDNNVVGIDIDVGFDDGILSPLCSDIMQHCQSYTEKSKSGRGVHILLHGSLPFFGKNNLEGVEIYKAKRFFIMTGNVLIFPKIIDNQEAIDYVVQKYFKEEPKSPREPLSNINRKIYSPQYEKPSKDKKIQLRPQYPEIKPGGRNLSLTSLAGTLHNLGYSPKEIYKELMLVNKTKCKPPLPEREVQTITESVTRYRR